MRVNDLQAVIDQHRNCSAGHPGTNQGANDNQNENGRHGLRDLFGDRADDLIPRVAQGNGNNASNHGRCDKQRLHREARRNVAAAQKDDQRDRGNCRDQERWSAVSPLLRGGD